MKLIVAGSRHLNGDYRLLTETIFSYFGEDHEIKEIVEGGCSKGPDQWARFLYEHAPLTKDIEFHTQFEADWETHGKAAGPIRNRAMAKYADQLLLIWDGKSRGSANMKKEMLALGKPVHEVIIRSHNAST